jgi:hypothetical protein
MGKNTGGIIIIIFGVLVFLGGAAVSITATGRNMGGATLGVVLSLFVAAPVVGAGVFLLSQGRTEAGQQVNAERRRKILDMVKTQGQVNVSDLVIELNSSTAQVRDDVYKLVGMGLFTGYVNWDKGVLYSKEASQLRNGATCPNCGGEMSLSGKGVIACQFCGAEVFL